MIRKLFVAALAAASLFGSGCVFTRNDYVENVEFDLELPKFAPKRPVRMGVFRNLSGSDRRFMLRRGDGQVVSLEFQRWRMSPELLLQRCMYGAFDVVEDASGVPQLNATIYRFEFDERDKKAHLAVDFWIPGLPGRAPGARPLTVRVDEAVALTPGDDLAAARAAAMSECARKAVEKLRAGMGRK